MELYNNLELLGLPQINWMIIHVEEATLLSLYKEKCITETKTKNRSWTQQHTTCSLHQQSRPEMILPMFGCRNKPPANPLVLNSCNRCLCSKIPWEPANPTSRHKNNVLQTQCLLHQTCQVTVVGYAEPSYVMPMQKRVGLWLHNNRVKIKEYRSPSWIKVNARLSRC
jgi:hypothetical protein